ncbi:hypothetical protein VCRA2120E57_110046 [Vibrio crassostreae]|nr:hypothetical protein VCRA2120E57_110046 [Vibrio crassostreae]
MKANHSFIYWHDREIDLSLKANHSAYLVLLMVIIITNDSN